MKRWASWRTCRSVRRLDTRGRCSMITLSGIEERAMARHAGLPQWCECCNRSFAALGQKPRRGHIGSWHLACNEVLASLPTTEAVWLRAFTR
jgi:hypothetical protein